MNDSVAIEDLAKQAAANGKAIRRLIAVLAVAVVLSALLLLAVAAVGLAGYRELDEQRIENCVRVERAFDAYTVALGDITNADDDIVTEFTNAYRPQMERCA